MPVRAIVDYPDKRLHAVSKQVATFDEALRALADDLLETMRAANGVGITGPHIGALQRVVVLELPDVEAPQIYVNPEIVWSSTETIQHDEGSISMPGIVEKLTRFAKVRVQYQDLDGQHKIEEAEGFRAVCHQHEIDQLNGIFWIDRLSKLKRDRLLTRFAKLQRGA